MDQRRMAWHRSALLAGAFLAGCQIAPTGTPSATADDETAFKNLIARTKQTPLKFETETSGPSIRLSDQDAVIEMPGKPVGMTDRKATARRPTPAAPAGAASPPANASELPKAAPRTRVAVHPLPDLSPPAPPPHPMVETGLSPLMQHLSAADKAAAE